MRYVEPVIPGFPKESLMGSFLCAYITLSRASIHCWPAACGFQQESLEIVEFLDKMCTSYVNKDCMRLIP